MKVIYIGGWAKSGSTLVELLLGSHPGGFPCGEIPQALWRQAIQRGRGCSCGRSVPECEVWGRVLEFPVEGRTLSEVTPEWVMGLIHGAVRDRRAWRLLRLDPGAELDGPAREYRRLMRQLYLAVQGVTGARFIVDSNKNVFGAAIARLIPEVDLRFVHLVRDPRAAAFSWMRRRRAPLPNLPPPTVTSRESTRRWITRNLAAEAMVRRLGSERAMQLRYEDLVVTPRMAGGRIVRLAEEEPDGSLFGDDRMANLDLGHSLPDRRNRFPQGWQPIVLDDEWSRELPARDRWLVTALAAPFLPRYGYRLRSGSRAPGDR